MKKLFTAVLLSGAALSVFAQAAAPAASALPARPSINLSISEAIQIALQKNFDVKLQDLTLANSKESYNSAKLEYKPTMSVSAGKARRTASDALIFFRKS